uniref:Erythromycin biosynthesis protein CIII-like C-terminal domain-containing protein n=1 Tax=Palpitomonas bilix TaxID=652834 RepID=A0A7S3D6E8_9EUKA|mmetsp:Transcript_2328/g.4816  ORF Transcript_2328/g.4816 Transcript_2328/m.4816 type:complete len:342 (+) Transcript_2328:401-1426(+)
MMKLAKLMRDTMLPHVDTIARTFIEMCKEVDLVIGTGLHQAEAFIIAKKLGKKYVGVSLQPVIATREFSFSLIFPNVFGWLNRMSYHLFDFMSARSDLAKRVRELLGGVRLPSTREWEKRVVLHAFSPSLLPPPPDWNEECAKVVGCFEPTTGGGGSGTAKLSHEVEAFLERGDPPLYVGFGSMPIPNTEVVEKMINAVVDELGVRVIFCQGWCKSICMQREGKILTVASAPHSLLLPRCIAAVHHGGAGTTASSTAAGIPTVILPVLMDQYLWADIVGRRGVGPKHTCPLRKVTPSAFVDYVREALSPSCLRHARELGLSIQRENGVVNACNEISMALHT